MTKLYVREQFISYKPSKLESLLERKLKQYNLSVPYAAVPYFPQALHITFDLRITTEIERRNECPGCEYGLLYVKQLKGAPVFEAKKIEIIDTKKLLDMLNNNDIKQEKIIVYQLPVYRTHGEIGFIMEKTKDKIEQMFGYYIERSSEAKSLNLFARALRNYCKKDISNGQIKSLFEEYKENIDVDIDFLRKVKVEELSSKIIKSLKTEVTSEDFVNIMVDYYALHAKQLNLF